MSRGRFDGRSGPEDENGNQIFVLEVVDDTPVTTRDTDFVVGDSPAIFDVNAALGRNGKQFTVINDGPGDFDVSTSNNGAAFGDEHTMLANDTYKLENVNIASIRIIHVGDSAYRIVAI